MKGATIKRIVEAARENPDLDWYHVLTRVLIEIERENENVSGIGA